jgi:hypothetical protein
MEFRNFARYEAWFREEYDKFQMPLLAKECGPFIGPTSSFPDRPPWKLEWWIVYADGNFVKLQESYTRAQIGKPYSGRRQHFSFHYGVHPGRVDSRGCPGLSTQRGTIIRLDNAPDYGDHLHYRGIDHIRQSTIKGNLKILEMSMFTFLEKIEEHRESGRSLEECFDFSLTGDGDE